jgi:serine/threonine-protein kinase
VTGVAPRLLDGRYRLRTVLGRGGMAVVWRGEDLRLQRPVAVKMLDDAVLGEPGMRERLGREARILGRLEHRNVVAMYDVDVTGDPAYLVLELVDGPSLEELLEQGPLPVPRAVEIAAQVCAALTAAHNAGIRHRDIKPANVILTADGTVKVCDFGIAQSPVPAARTEEGAVHGTGEYLAPERATGGPGDHRADLYALGCLLYAMLAGTPPFTAPNPVRVLYQHLNQQPRPLREVRDGIPAALDALVLDLLAKDPADRPATAEEVAGRLAALDDPPAADEQLAALGPPTAVLPVPAWRHRARGARHWRGWWVAAAVGGTLALGGVVALVSPARQPARSGGPAAVAPSWPDPTDAVPASPEASVAPSASAPVLGVAPAPTGPRRPALADQLAALKTLIGREAATGQLDAQAAAELRAGVDDVAFRVSKGQTTKAARGVAQLRDRLTAFAQDARLSRSGFQILAAAVDQLASSLAARTAR